MERGEERREKEGRREEAINGGREKEGKGGYRRKRWIIFKRKETREKRRKM